MQRSERLVSSARFQNFLLKQFVAQRIHSKTLLRRINIQNVSELVTITWYYVIIS